MTVGDAIVTGQTVTFPVRVTAKQTAVLDPAALETMVLGKPIPEAKAILAPFGEVEISVSPDWAGSVPSFDSRVDVTVEEPVRDRDARSSRARRRHDPAARHRSRRAAGRPGTGR